MCDQCKSLQKELERVKTQLDDREIELATRDDLLRVMIAAVKGERDISYMRLDEIETYLAMNYHTTDWDRVARRLEREG